MLKRDLCLYNRLRFAYLVATFSGKAPLNRNRTFLSGNHTLQFSCSSLDMFYSDRKKNLPCFCELWFLYDRKFTFSMLIFSGMTMMQR